MSNEYEREIDHEEWRRELIVNKSGACLGILANCITILTNHDRWRGVLAFDEFKHSVCTHLPLPWMDQPIGEWNDHLDTLTLDWLQREIGVLASPESVRAAVQSVARANSFHPVRDYLNHLQWDGMPRVDTWLTDYLGVQPSNYTAAVGRRWLISAVARIFRPGCKVDTCLILEGAQGAGKSTALQVLGAPWISECLSDIGTKDSMQELAAVWLIELAELDSMSRSEAGRVKAFMSRTADRFRPSHGRHVVERPRQCVFAGTVNHDTYLRDETGNRRFWPVKCADQIDIRALKKDRDQLWAETTQLFREGAVWWLNSEDVRKEAEEEVAARYESDAWENTIREWLNLTIRDEITINDVYLEALKGDRARLTRSDQMRITACLRQLGWHRFQKRTNNGRSWMYRQISNN